MRIPAGHHRVEVYEDQRGEWRWRRKAANNEIISDSNEGYSSRTAAVVGASLANQIEEFPVEEDYLDIPIYDGMPEPEQPDDTTRVVTKARFRGVCSYCREAIVPGMRVAIDDEGSFQHENCSYGEPGA